ncbi:MAG: OmpA family protein [Proteobacteria bacterium]|nr:OmpA family protein [Pseudomonadota bacterium]
MHACRRLGAALLLSLALLVPCSRALAQVSGGPVDLQLFRPAIDSKGYITLDASQVLGHLNLSFGLVLNYARRPFSIAGPPTGGTWCADPSTPGTACSPEARLLSRYQVKNLATGQLQAAVGLFRHLELGIGLPLTLWDGDTTPNPAARDHGSIDAQGVGDLVLHLKGRILDTSRYPVGLALVTSVTLPTGDEHAFLGSGRVGLLPRLVVDREFLRGGRLKLALNVGTLLRFGSNAGWTDERLCALQGAAGVAAACGTGRTLSTDDQLVYGAAIAFDFVPQRLQGVAELIGQTGFDGLYDRSRLNSAHEALAGLKVYLADNSYLALGLGRGLRGGGDNFQYGSPDVRAFLAFVFEPSIGDRDGDGIKDDVDRCPTRPEDFDGFEDEDGCPDPDNDGDGILDGDDKCPNEPEDKDGYQDEDGCPETESLDRDGDGIPDDRDQCPDEPEDKDGFEDEDGCPDPDNDRDGILDLDDLCPNEPEDKDGFEDEDGCPDPDNDKDRILDKDDQCPNEPETYNGNQDEDGCPDKGRVIVRHGALEILDKVYFETARAVIMPVSFPILDAVAATLRGNPQIELVEVQGHADERGNDGYNLTLTEQRSEAVRQALIERGVAAERLEAHGYGETKPIDPAHNLAAWSKNRRVEFIILKRATE